MGLTRCPFRGIMARGIEGTKIVRAASSEDLGSYPSIWRSPMRAYQKEPSPKDLNLSSNVRWHMENAANADQ